MIFFSNRQFSNQSGYTLIELMIVVAIVGILAAIAYPSYAEYIRKGKRAEGRAAVLALMQDQEKYKTQRNTYAALSLGATGTSFKTWSGDGGLAGANYQLQATACSSSLAIKDCVLVTAVPQFTDTQAGNLVYDSLGNKSCSGSSPEKCWK